MSELGLAIAYVTNTLSSRMAMNDPRGLELLDAAVRCARVDFTGPCTSRMGSESFGAFLRIAWESPSAIAYVQDGERR